MTETVRRGFVVVTALAVAVLVTIALVTHAPTLDGSVVRAIPLTDNPEVDGVAVDEQTGRAFVLTRQAVTTPTGGRVVVVNSANGQPEQTHTVTPIPMGMAVEEHAHRVFVAAAGFGSTVLHLFDARSGTYLGMRPAGPGAPWAITAAQGLGYVIVANDHNGVDLFDGQTGRAVGTVAVGCTALALAVDEGRGYVVAVGEGLHGMGCARIVDLRHKRVVSALSLPARPRGVAVDPGTRHILAVSQGL